MAARFPISIRRAVSTEDADIAWRLEQALKIERPEAADEGFLLPSSQHEYRDLQRSGIMLLAFIQGEFVGFVLALPPNHERIDLLLAQENRFQKLEPGVFVQPLLWIAKVGVVPGRGRKGIGTLLYNELFRRYPTTPVMTATLSEPVRNIASKRFHERMGFRVVGHYSGGDRAGLSNLVNSIVYRPGR